MAREPEIRVDLVMRPGDRTVTGEIRSAGGASEAYAGWLGLLAVLSSLAEAHSGASPREDT